MRVFIATDTNEKVKAVISDLQQQLADKLDAKKSDVKWVRPEAMHLTLKFLGEIKDQQVYQVCNIVEQAAVRHKCFDLDIECVGSFGGKSARVLWVGCGKGSAQLCHLQNDIEQQLASAGWPEEKRKFTGHLTLCRIRNPKAGQKLAQIAQTYNDLKVGTVAVDSVTVYQSQLRPGGPVYTRLGSYKLKNPNPIGENQNGKN